MGGSIPPKRPMEDAITGQTLWTTVYHMLRKMVDLGAPAVILEEMSSILEQWPKEPVSCVRVVFARVTRTTESAGHPAYMWQCLNGDIRSGYFIEVSHGRCSIKTKIKMNNVLRITGQVRVNGLRWTRKTLYMRELPCADATTAP